MWSRERSIGRWFLLRLVLALLPAIACWHCARYPALPEFQEDEAFDYESKIEDQEAEARMREMLLSLSTDSVAQDYRVGRRDVLGIEVFQQKELTSKEEVSEAGTITLPLIGDVHVEGKTPAEVQEEITERLKGRYLVDPKVDVQVLEYKSKFVSVLGEVGGRGGKGGGKQPLRGNTTLLEVLTEAGLSPEAGSECIVIRKHRNGSTNDTSVPGQQENSEVIRIDLDALMQGDLLQNIVLKDGDAVYVPKAESFFVFGEVKEPGRYKYAKGTTVLKAVTTAGGLTEKAASIKRVKILREEAGRKERISANPTDLIKPEDTIIVPETFF